MSITIALSHHTSYRYASPVALGPQIIRLHPAPHARTPIPTYALTVAPSPHDLRWHRDAQGNALARVLIPEPTSLFTVTVELTAELIDLNPFDFFVEPEAAEWPFSYPALLEAELAPCRTAGPVSPWLAHVLHGLSLEPQPSVDLLVALNQLVRDRIGYVQRLEPGVQSPEETLDRGRGSCRDVAWLLVQTARNLGFAARFVSGYLIQLADAARPAPGIDADMADLHAWAEMYLPGAGWIGFDATSGLMTGSGHIPLAASVHPVSAAPITGTAAASVEHFDTRMTVTRLSAPAVSAATVYSSSNGDRWSVAHDPVTGSTLVRHEPNAASGGHAADLPIELFLARGGSGPEHAAVRRFLAETADRRGSTDAHTTDLPR